MPLQPDAMQILYREKLHLVGRPGLKPLGPTIDIRELAGIPLILPGPNESLRTLMEMVAAQRGIKLNIVVEGDTYNTVRLLIEDGLGYGVLPRFALLPDLRNGTLQASRLVNPEVERSVVLTTCSNRVPAAGLKELVDVVKKVVQETIEPANAATIPDPAPPNRMRR
jgi:LysR family nitrogen assimilation transcriptional regulator